ncbi:hypothetical protein HDU98_002945 [Podochytrium sp. JEL0797]|nr:hypothetical protein HDU98_002945 [Podochytrium sp. JEL0797]
MKTSAIFALAFLCIEASAYQNLSQADAQQAANGLWGKIRGLGGCLFSNNLPSSAPSQNLAALWLRAIFHDAGTFNANASNGAGGLDGSLALSAEYNLPVNGGINASLANRFLPPGSKLTNSDAIALGGRSIADIVANLPSNATAPVSEIAAGFARMGLNQLDMLKERSQVQQMLFKGRRSHKLVLPHQAHKQESPKQTCQQQEHLYLDRVRLVRPHPTPKQESPKQSRKQLE